MPSTEEGKNVAVGFSLVVGLSDNSQITFQSGFEGDETDEAVNARIDRIVRIAHRQKALNQIPDVERDLAQQRATLAQFREDLERVNLDHDKQQAQRALEIEERVSARETERRKFEAEINTAILQMQEARQAQWNEGAMEHQRSGRASSYKPAGVRATNIAKIESAIEKAKENREGALEDFDRDYDARIQTARDEIERAEAEREQSLRSLNISVKHYQEAISASEEKLSKAQALVGR